MRGVPRQEQGIEDVPLCPRQRRAQLQPLQDVGIRGARLQVTHRLPEPVQTMKMSPEISAGVLPPPRPGGCPPYPGIWGFSRGEAPAAAAGMKENSGCVCVPAGAQPAAIPARNGLDRAGNPAQPQGPATGGINSNPPHPDPPEPQSPRRGRDSLGMLSVGQEGSEDQNSLGRERMEDTREGKGRRDLGCREWDLSRLQHPDQEQELQGAAAAPGPLVRDKSHHSHSQDWGHSGGSVPAGPELGLGAGRGAEGWDKDRGTAGRWRLCHPGAERWGSGGTSGILCREPAGTHRCGFQQLCGDTCKGAGAG